MWSLTLPSVDFAHPERLFYLLCLLPIALSVWSAGRRRRADWAALARVTRPPKNRGWNWIAAIAFLCTALAQPRWGRLAEQTPPGHDVVLLVDVSRSMAAEDATPNRLGRAIAEAQSLLVALGKERGDRAAVVAFAGEGELRCPLTEHLGAAYETLKELQPGEVQPGGSDFGQALLAALSAFDQEDRTEGRAIVVFSDGESHDESWRAVSERLKSLKVIVHGVTIGDAAGGHEIPAGPDHKPLKYHDEVVLSRRSDASLREICKMTGGMFIPLGLSRGDLGELYRTRIAPAERRTRSRDPATDRVERFPVFVAAALACGLFGSWPVSGRRGVLALLLVVTLGAATPPRTAREAVEHGNTAFRAGALSEALGAFEAAIALDPKSPIPRYNAGAVLYAAQRFDEAAERYEEASARADAALKTKIDYALGNAALAQGSIALAIQHYDHCLASQVSGAEYDRVRNDARQNRIFAEEHRPPRSSEAGEEEGQGREPRPRPDRKGGRSADASDDAAKDSPDAPQQGQEPPPGPAQPTLRQAPLADRTRKDKSSPEDRLAAALEAVREAEGQRLPDQPTVETSGDRKDW
jgi:Ca-activated chloride channel family protein